MKNIRDILKEANKGKSIVLTFGRFQPPTTGHEKLIKKVVDVARKNNADHLIFPSRSNDPKKNPLSPKDKVRIMRQLFKFANIADEPDAKTPFHAMKMLSDRGYKNVFLVVGSDRVKELDKQIRPYIKHSDPKKSFEFDTFQVVSAGERDPDATDVTGMSGSKMRALAAEGDFDSFLLGVPGQQKRTAKSLYDALRKGMGVRESSLEDDWDQLCLLEQKGSEKVTVVALTKSQQDLSDTLGKVDRVCSKMGVPFYAIHTEKAHFSNEDLAVNEIVVHNFDGKGKKITLDAHNTVCLVRGGSLVNQAGLGLARVFEESGAFMVNNLESMEFCHNKFATSLAFDINKIPTPRTALVTNEDAIEPAHKQIGSQFPVVIKTITGAEGIGVSLVESPASLKSVLQSLWKLDGEVIMQEYMEIDHDVRTIILDGKILASVKRKKGTEGKDFRTNYALGNTVEPYDLSEEEKKFVTKLAKVSGAYFCGVDHITVGGKLYALEVNGSPGSGAEPYRGYMGKFEGEDLSSMNMIQQFLEYITDKENWRYPTSEIGVVENITVDGTKYKARIDTGNSTYNSIHADDINLNGNKVTFKMNGKKRTMPVVEVLTVNVGAGVEEMRPVVEFDVRFGVKQFKKIKFSLADRGENNYPVLVGKEFLTRTKHSVNVARTFTLFESNLDKRFSEQMAQIPT